MSDLAFSISATNGPRLPLVGSYTNAWPSGDLPIVGGPTVVIPREEAYYWSMAWQDGERESLAGHARGDSVVFDSDDPNDVIRWLLS